MSSLPPRRPGRPADYDDYDRPARKSNNTLLIVLAVSAACVVMLCAGIGILTALLLPAVQQAREAARRTQAKNELKQIGFGAFSFHDVHTHFPPLAADGSDGPEVSSPISFQTSLLPFLEQAPLYERVDKSIGWDEDANKPAYSTVVTTFLSPQFAERTTSNGYAAAHFVPNSQLIQNGRGLRLSDITDGTSNTILDGQVKTAFPAWGDPANPRDPANGFAGGANAFGGSTGGALIGMADGSVRFISENVSPEVAAKLASPAGSEAIRGDEF